MNFRKFVIKYELLGGFPAGGSAGKESTCNAEDTGDRGLIPKSGRSPGGRHGNSLQYSCLKNSVDRGAGDYSPVQCSCSVVSYSLQSHGLQHARLLCLSLTPSVYSNSCPLHWWCHPTASSSVGPFSFRLQSFPASGSFPMSQLFASGGQSIGVSASASVLPMNVQDWSPLGWTGWISLLSKGLSRIFSNTTVQKHQFFSAQLSL